MAKKSKRLGEFEELPTACIATILSHTTPTDACGLSVVSKTLHSASDSDDVWNYFLPSDSNFINSIISHSPSLIANASTKKALFLALSDRPFLFDDGKKSFQLVKKSGKICYMLSARSLNIDWEIRTGRKENWISMINSRFPDVAELCDVLRFEIRGTINTLSLTPNTRYAAYLVFKMNGAYEFQNKPAKLSVGVEDGRFITKSVCLDPYFRWVLNGHHHGGGGGGRRRHTVCCIPSFPPKVVGLQRPCVRSDGWFEIEMGKFFNSNLENKEVRMSVIQKKGGGKMENFFLEGIEVRPKEDEDENDGEEEEDDDDEDDDGDDDDDDDDMD